MTIQIEKNIPVPAPSNRGAPAKYPFADMAVGDSFAVPLTGVLRKYGNQKGSIDAAHSTITSSAIYHAKKMGCKFTVRINNEEGVVRCWRVA